MGAGGRERIFPALFLFEKSLFAIIDYLQTISLKYSAYSLVPIHLLLQERI
jgi:hypothetical protein